jgi:hypothetical protein
MEQQHTRRLFLAPTGKAMQEVLLLQSDHGFSCSQL